MLSSHLALPIQGHLSEVYFIFSYLKGNHNAELVFHLSEPDISANEFLQRDWGATEFEDKLEEELPENCPKPLGLGVIMHAHVDANHAIDSVTQRPRTGFTIYLNIAVIFWASKKQNSVKISSFGNKFMAIKHCSEYV